MSHFQREKEWEKSARDNYGLSMKRTVSPAADVVSRETTKKAQSEASQELWEMNGEAQVAFRVQSEAECSKKARLRESL